MTVYKSKTRVIYVSGSGVLLVRHAVDLDPMVQLNGVRRGCIRLMCLSSCVLEIDRELWPASFTVSVVDRLLAVSDHGDGDGGNGNRFNLLLFQRHFSSAIALQVTKVEI